MNISDHAHPMHKGPHYEKYVHEDNRCSVSTSMKGSHELGDKNHISEMMGEPKGADVEGHKGQMKW